MFYAVNGWWLMTTQEDLVDLVLDVVEGRLRGVGRSAIDYPE